MGFEAIGPAIPVDGVPHSKARTIAGIPYTITQTCSFPTSIACTFSIDFSSSAANAPRFPVGTWTYRLTYTSSGGLYRSSVSSRIPVTVIKSNTRTSSVAVTGSPGGTDYAVNVRPIAPGTGVPTSGTVQFYLDGSTFGAPVPVVNGQAVLHRNGPPRHGTFRAVFSGNASYNGSSGPPMPR